MTFYKLFPTQFRPKKSVEKILADQTVYVWDPEWSHMLLFNNPNDNSSATIATISVQGDYSRVIPLTNDTTPLNYNAIFKERTSNNSSNSTFIIIHTGNL